MVPIFLSEVASEISGCFLPLDLMQYERSEP
jgi:hypothetical protein